MAATVRIGTRGLLATAVAAAVVLTASPAPVKIAPISDELAAILDDGPFLLLHPGDGEPFTVDTTSLRAPALRAWWFDRSTGVVVDAGSVPSADAVDFYSPETGEEIVEPDWMLIIDDAARPFGPPGTPLADTILPR